jgi:predicted nucleotidyltransferase
MNYWYMKYRIDSQNLAFSGEGVVAYFQLLNTVARRLNTDFLVVGAFARDLLLTHVLGARPGLQTEDVDIGIQLVDWASYRVVVNSLLEHGYRKGQSAHVYFGPVGLRTDLLPFGPLEDSRSISFADSDHISMDMTGFAESFPQRIEFELEDGTTFCTPNPAGMVLLKLSAWNELYPWNKATKHVRDIGLLMEAFFDGTIDRIETTLIFSGVFDMLPDPLPIYHTAVVLGRQVKALCHDYPETLTTLQSIYDKIRTDERELFLTPFATALMTNKATARETVRCFFDTILNQ